MCVLGGNVHQELQQWEGRKAPTKSCSSKQPRLKNEENEGGIFLEQPFGRYCAASWNKVGDPQKPAILTAPQPYKTAMFHSRKSS